MSVDQPIFMFVNCCCSVLGDWCSCPVPLPERRSVFFRPRQSFWAMWLFSAWRCVAVEMPSCCCPPPQPRCTKPLPNCPCPTPRVRARGSGSVFHFRKGEEGKSASKQTSLEPSNADTEDHWNVYVVTICNTHTYADRYYSCLLSWWHIMLLYLGQYSVIFAVPVCLFIDLYRSSPWLLCVSALLEKVRCVGEDLQRSVLPRATEALRKCNLGLDSCTQVKTAIKHWYCQPLSFCNPYTT